MPDSESKPQIKLGATDTSRKTLYIAIALGAVGALANFVFVSRVEGARVEVMKANNRLPAGTKVTDVSSLAKLSQLKELKVGKLKPRGIDELKKGLPNLVVK